MTRSAVTPDFVSQYPQPWQRPEGAQGAPHFFSNNVIADVAHGGAGVADVVQFPLPDEGMAWRIDDIVLTPLVATLYVAGVSAATVAVGVYGTTDAGVAKDVAAYFVGATALPNTAIGGTISLSGGDFTWAATADTEAERTFRGGALLRLTAVAANGAGSTGTFIMSVRAHLVGHATTAEGVRKYAQFQTEPAVL